MAIRRRFVVESSGKINVAVGWFALSNVLCSREESTALIRNRWYRLHSNCGTIYRVLRFSPLLNSGIQPEEGEIALDWDGYLELWGQQEKTQPKELIITHVSPLQAVACAWLYPDPAIRIGLQVAIVLGGASVVISIIGFLLRGV